MATPNNEKAKEPQLELQTYGHPLLQQPVPQSAIVTYHPASAPETNRTPISTSYTRLESQGIMKFVWIKIRTFAAEHQKSSSCSSFGCCCVTLGICCLLCLLVVGGVISFGVMFMECYNMVNHQSKYFSLCLQMLKITCVDEMEPKEYSINATVQSIFISMSHVSFSWLNTSQWK